MKTACLLIPLLAITVGTTAHAARRGAARRAMAPVVPKVQPVDANYPYSEIGKVYDTVLDEMTSKYFKNYPNLDKEHTAALRTFIAKECGREEFIKKMVRDKNVAVFDRAKADAGYRNTKEFQDSFTVVTSVSVQMAWMIVSGLRDVYVAKFVEKDPLKIELLEMASTDDQRQYATWVHGEVTAEEFRTKAGAKREMQPGDRFFAFFSPPATWKKRCGREGFLQVRDKKIIQVIVTTLN